MQQPFNNRPSSDMRRVNHILLCNFFSFAVRGTKQHGDAADGYTKEVGYLPEGSCQKEASDETNSTQSQYCFSILLNFNVLKVINQLNIKTPFDSFYRRECSVSYMTW